MDELKNFVGQWEETEVESNRLYKYKVFELRTDKQIRRHVMQINGVVFDWTLSDELPKMFEVSGPIENTEEYNWVSWGIEVAEDGLNVLGYVDPSGEKQGLNINPPEELKTALEVATGQDVIY